LSKENNNTALARLGRKEVAEERKALRPGARKGGDKKRKTRGV